MYAQVYQQNRNVIKSEAISDLLKRHVKSVKTQNVMPHVPLPQKMCIKLRLTTTVVNQERPEHYFFTLWATLK